MLTTGDVPSQAVPMAADAAPNVHLVVQKGARVGSRIQCRRIVTVLGSRSGCKANLQHGLVAPVHVAIVNHGAQVSAVDLVTARGTYLNGLKMGHEQLNDGDILTVGPWEFRVEIRKPRNNGHDDVHPFDLDPSPDLVALEHVATRRILQPNRGVCVIGRRSGCDITLSDAYVSRVHALLLTYFDYPAICDLLSKNGTRVNDKRVAFGRLRNDDLVQIGGAEFRVRLVGSSVVEQAASKGQAAEPVVKLASEVPPPDLIDIQTTEGSQRWRIAESAKEATQHQ